MNVTGTADLAPLDKQAEIVKELVPSAKTVGILYCSAEANSKFQADKITEYFKEMNLEVKEYTAADSNDIASVTTSACSEVDVLYLSLIHISFGAPLKTPKRSYIFMTKSSDQGKTWSEPKDITGDILLKSDSTFLGVAPGNGIALKDGRLVFTVYTLRGGSASIYSDDNGETWKRDTTQKYIRCV